MTPLALALGELVDAARPPVFAVVMNEEAVVTADALIELCASIEDTLYEAGTRNPVGKSSAQHGLAEIRQRLLHEADQLCHLLRGTQLPDGLLGELLDRNVELIGAELNYSVGVGPSTSWSHARHYARIAKTRTAQLRADLLRVSEGGGRP